MTQIELFSANVCPYAHRTRLTLLEKNLDFKSTEIDLQNKPDWFLKISPSGKVPLLKHGNNLIWESTIINEYLDEVFPKPALMPSEPAQKAYARILIDFANTKFVFSFYKLLLAQEEAEQEKWKQALTQHLQFLETEALANQYFINDSLTLVDLTFYPWFERWTVVEHYRNFPLSKYPKLTNWFNTMSARETVKSIAHNPEFYISNYQQYANNTATGITAQEIRDS